ncbi:MAG: hypothetical protein HY299_05055 [Verrucomicrobia bacterium]|nr:hypothetical protein [Verrucomicrobiota bacterium]
MALLDFILNLSALLLWLNWSYLELSRRESRPAGISLFGTLKTTAPPLVSSWPYLAGCVGLLLLRALVYHTIGSNLRVNLGLSLGIIPIPFTPRLLSRMFLFSFLSFGVFAGVFYFGLVLFSMINRGVAEPDACLRLVRIHLAGLHKRSVWVQALVPGALTALFWLATGPLLESLGLFPVQSSWTVRSMRAVLLGAYAYVTWTPSAIAVLILYSLSNHVYFGNTAFWNFVQVSGRNLLQPIAGWGLRSRRIDWTPLVVILLLAWIGWKGGWGRACGGAHLLIQGWHSVH